MGDPDGCKRPLYKYVCKKVNEKLADKTLLAELFTPHCKEMGIKPSWEKKTRRVGKIDILGLSSKPKKKKKKTKTKKKKKKKQVKKKRKAKKGKKKKVGMSKTSKKSSFSMIYADDAEDDELSVSLGEHAGVFRDCPPHLFSALQEKV